MKGLIVGIIFILLGASGEFALKGTNSPVALILVGVVFCVLGIIRIVSDNMEDTKEVPVQLTAKQKMYQICKTCSNYKFDMKTGVSCGLTDSKPDFNENCIHYKGSTN